MWVDRQQLDTQLLGVGGDAVAQLRELNVTYGSGVAIDENQDNRLLSAELAQSNALAGNCA